MRFRLLTIFASAAVLLASAAHAQSAPSAEPSPRQLELAREFASIIQGEDLEALILDSMRQQAARRGKSSLSSTERKAVEEAVVQVVMEFVDDFLERMTPIYARTYTQDELEAAIEFFRSPVGRSVITKSVRLASQEQALMLELMPALMDKMITRTCAVTGCSLEEMAEARASAAMVFGDEDGERGRLTTKD